LTIRNQAHAHGSGWNGHWVAGDRRDCEDCCPQIAIPRIRDQENRIRVAIDDLVEFLNVMGAE
jgi:hypothetical protein